MSTNRYLQQAAAGAAGGSMVPTGPVIGLECVCTFQCLLNCSCCMCITDLQGYAYGEKQWMGVSGAWYGGACYGGIGIMHYDDESCWALKRWDTCSTSGFGNGLHPFGLYIHPISGYMFAAGKGGACTGYVYLSGGVDSSTSPGAWGQGQRKATTTGGGITGIAAVGDTAIAQSSYYNGGNILSGGCQPFCGDINPQGGGGYCEANCCFFYSLGRLREFTRIPRQCNGGSAPTGNGVEFCATAASTQYCCWRVRGTGDQFFVDEDGVVHATRLVCKCNGCYGVKSSTAMYSWGVFLSLCNIPISNLTYTGLQYIYSCNNVLKAGSCCLCYPGTSDPVTANSGFIRSTVLRDRVYIAICQTLYRGIQG